jgi:SAM-dependent methyltransferase
MLDAKSVVSAYYKGDSGRKYLSKHRSEAFVQNVVAKQRAGKLQPHVGPGDVLLEFGVGTCLNMRYLNCQRRDGYDINPDSRRHCADWDINFIESEAEIAEGSYSCILCHHVLEHVADPLDTLVNLRSWLQPQGRLILCVPFETHRSFRSFHPEDPNRHLFSWNVNSIGHLVTSAGFRVEVARVGPYGYEQRLAVAARLGLAAYKMVLSTVRFLRPANEVFLVGKRA